MVLATRLAALAVESGRLESLHVVVTGAAGKVLSHELGPEWSTAKAICAGLPIPDNLRSRLHPWSDSELSAPIASGSHVLDGVAVVPCSAGMAGAIAHGISRGLAQRVADVALKQRWPLVVGIRETPLSQIALENLLRLALAGAHIVPPVPAFYLGPEPASAYRTFIDHYCMRVLDLLGITFASKDLRWQG